MNVNVIFALTNTEVSGLYAFGNNGDLVSKSSTDMKNFKRITTFTGMTTEKVRTANTLIMGRKTFESMNSKSLPNRHTIVITNSEDFDYDENLTASSLEEAINIAENSIKCGECFIIGGVCLIQEAIRNHATTAYITLFDYVVPECDTMYKTGKSFIDGWTWINQDIYEEHDCVILGEFVECDMAFIELIKDK